MIDGSRPGRVVRQAAPCLSAEVTHGQRTTDRNVLRCGASFSPSSCRCASVLVHQEEGQAGCLSEWLMASAACVRVYALWVIQHQRQPDASVAADFGALHRCRRTVVCVRVSLRATFRGSLGAMVVPHTSVDAAPARLQGIRKRVAAV